MSREELIQKLKLKSSTIITSNVDGWYREILNYMEELGIDLEVPK